MTLTVRLPDRLEQKLAEYCTTYRVTKSEAVKHALEDLLEPSSSGTRDSDHPYIGCDKGDGSDVSGNIKAALRTRVSQESPMRSAIADSGFVVALGIARDPRHDAAKAFLNNYKGEILVPAPVVIESCYFLSTAAKIRLIDWLMKERIRVIELTVDAYPEIGKILARYADLDPDFTDAAVVWLADKIGCRSILTVDKRDFGIYRLKGGKRFEVLKWFE